MIYRNISNYIPVTIIQLWAAVNKVFTWGWGIAEL